MRNNRTTLLLIALCLALASTALASNTWYVDGVNGSDTNDCKTSPTACHTIGHAIALASSRDTINVAPATYRENLTIPISLKVIGSDAKTTIIDGGQNGTVVTVSNTKAHVTLSKLTMQNGYAGHGGGGILNDGTLTVNDSTLSGNSAGNGDGGGIHNNGTLTVNKSTLSGTGIKEALDGEEIVAHCDASINVKSGRIR
jgi:hypothetical protein